MDKTKNTLNFWVWFITSFVIFTSAIMLFVKYVDPRGVFGTNKFPVIVATARQEKMSLIKQMHPKPQVLILGSSHCMRFSPTLVEEFTGKKTFNFSVNSGKIEDFTALLEYSIRKLDIVPELIILGVSTRTFSHIDEEPFDSRLISNDALIQYVPINFITKFWYRSKLWLQTLNFNYLTDIKKSIEISKLKGNNYHYSFEENGFLNKDGPINEKDIFLQENFKKDAEITGFSEKRINFFDLFLDICKTHNIDLKVVITPYDPVYIQRVNSIDGSYQKLVNQLVYFLESRNRDNAFQLYDYSNIKSYNGLPEFIGAGHPTIYNSSLLLRKLLSDKK